MKKLIFSLVIAATASAANAEAPTGVYIPFGVMGYDYDESQRVLEGSALGTFGVGYRFDQRWAAEVMTALGDADVDVSGGGEADVRHYRVDGLYFLNDMGALTPYVVAGLGETEVDYDLGSTTDDTQLNAGVGLLFQATDRLSVRGDVRAINSLDEGNTEAAVNLLAQFNFGSTSEPAASPADDDQDGVVNGKDRCPTTPPNKTVDKNGCDCNYTLNLNFEFDSAVLTEADKAKLEQLHKVVEDLGYTRSNVAGYTDNLGEDAYNQDLSQRRAQAVVDFMVERGVNANNLMPVGHGESDPVADNSTDAGRAANRRVVIERTDCGK